MGYRGKQGTVLAVVLVLGLAGCTPRPSARELIQGEPVYHNPQEGFRFTAPPGWSLHGRGDLPPGPAGQERPLVKYKRMPSSKPTFFRVSMVDLDPAGSLTDYLVRRPPGHEEWRMLTDSVQPVEVDRVAGIRVTYTGRWNNENGVKEVVAVRRGGRVYFFTGIFCASDTKSRSLVREAVASITWDGAGGQR